MVLPLVHVSPEHFVSRSQRRSLIAVQQDSSTQPSLTRYQEGTMVMNIDSTTATTQTALAAGRQRMQAINSAAAKYLGLSPQDLNTQLESGKSLSDIATAQGKSVDGLKSAMLDATQGTG